MLNANERTEGKSSSNLGVTIVVIILHLVLKLNEEIIRVRRMTELKTHFIRDIM